MGELRTLTPRADSPARRVLTTAETWAVLGQALQNAHGLLGEAVGLIERGAPVAETFDALRSFNSQIAAASPVVDFLHAAEMRAADEGSA